MKINDKLLAFALLAMTASCGTMSGEASDQDMDPAVAVTEAAPAPAGEMAGMDMMAETDMPSSETAIGEDGQIPPGRFEGDLVLDEKRMTVVGAGAGETVIDGDLILTSQCNVSGLTVTGDVIFTGNNSQVRVEYLGQVLDYGMQNRF